VDQAVPVRQVEEGRYVVNVSADMPQGTEMTLIIVFYGVMVVVAVIILFLLVKAARRK
jgi:hypothetical protein